MLAHQVMKVYDLLKTPLLEIKFEDGFMFLIFIFYFYFY